MLYCSAQNNHQLDQECQASDSAEIAAEMTVGVSVAGKLMLQWVC